MYAFISWDVSPTIHDFGFWAIRWYSLLFASGFILSSFIMSDIFKREGHSQEELDKLTIYMVVATVLGARLGHCLFYDPTYYLANPLEIFKVWEGGLASHGAAVGILVALFLFTRNTPGVTYLWILDRIVIVVALCGSLIRLGNLFNSEIVGRETNLPWGFIFLRNNDTIPRHPAQVYEAISCFFLFLLLYALYRWTDFKEYKGRLFGLFCVFCFGLRFFYEFLKENQEKFEDNMVLNMGQWLSIPLVAIGIYFIFKSRKEKIA
jgi:prolipoprotein diacylglyceryl transferase